MGIFRFETSSAMMVPMPEASSVTPTSNLVRIATSTVAGNMVSTCWKPSEISAPTGGISAGIYPFTVVWDSVDISLSFGLV